MGSTPITRLIGKGLEREQYSPLKDTAELGTVVTSLEEGGLGGSCHVRCAFLESTKSSLVSMAGTILFWELPRDSSEVPLYESIFEWHTWLLDTETGTIYDNFRSLEMGINHVKLNYPTPIGESKVKFFIPDSEAIASILIDGTGMKEKVEDAGIIYVPGVARVTRDVRPHVEPWMIQTMQYGHITNWGEIGALMKPPPPANARMGVSLC